MGKGLLFGNKNKPAGSNDDNKSGGKLSLIAMIGQQLKKKVRAQKEDLEKERSQYMSI